MLKPNGNDLNEGKMVSGLQGIAMINHGSEVTISVKNPLGRRLRIDTTFIGTNSHNDIILELPTLSQSDFNQYFCEGFWLRVKAISEKGEGAFINFKAQILRIIFNPIRLLVLEMPVTAELHQLRSEPRYDVRLQGSIILPNRKLLVDFKDLSKHGCCFHHDVTGLIIEEDSRLSILVENPNTGQEYFLTGLVKNTQRNGVLNSYGLKFDTLGNQQVKRLFSQLFFDGFRLSFKCSSK